MKRALIAAGLAVCVGFSAWQATSLAHADAADGIDWHDCGERLSCGTLTVPVDWATPDGPTTKVNLSMLRAADPQHSHGPLLANFTSGNSTSVLTDPLEPVRKLAEDFDVVAFDPRGIGSVDNGTFITCAQPPPPLTDLLRADGRADWQAHEAGNAAHDASCRQAAGADYAGLTSWQIAHDMDAIRAALGQRTLNYLGNSYGTSYGQAYAELFTDRVGRMYLEGVADHTEPDLSAWLERYALTQEEQFDHFMQWCAQRENCALHGEDIDALWSELVETAQHEPIPAPGAGEGQTVDQGDLFAGIHHGMNPPLWPTLAVAMAAAHDGDASDFLTELQVPPSPSPGSSVQNVLLCHDFMPEVPGYRQAMRLEEQLRETAPRFGWLEVRFELARCAGIEGQPTYPPHPLEAAGLPPVLVAIGDVDNNTNRLGAEHAAAQLPGAAVLRHGDGHSAFMMGNGCLADHVTAYLRDGTLPQPDTRCPGELVDQIPDRPAD
jgi:pimeloyl-ACP methyl ester carboxylesterase